MPFTGATFNLLTNDNYPAVDQEVIDPEAHNAMLEDLAQGLTDALTRDGSGSMSGDLNMGSNKITALLAATNPGDAPRFDQITPADATLIAIGGLTFSGTDAFLRATGADAFVAEAAAAHRTALVVPGLADANTFTGSANTFSSTAPLIYLQETDAAANNRLWDIFVTGEQMLFGVVNDAVNAVSYWLTVDRTGTTVDTLSFAATAMNFNGSAVLTAAAIGVTVQGYDADLGAVAGLSSSGLIARTGAGTAAARTLTGTANEITVTNGDGVSGNPTLSLPSALTFTGKTVTGGSYASPALTGTATIVNATVSGDLLLPSAPSTISELTAGFRGMPFNNQNTSYTFVLGDDGKFVFTNAGGPFTHTIPPNSSVAFPIGTTIVVGCGGGVVLNIAEGVGVTLYRFDGVAGTGTRIVTPDAPATLYKFGTNSWLIMGIVS